MLQDATGGDRDLLTSCKPPRLLHHRAATDEEVLFFVHGPAASGKSTFLESLKATLGDYSKTADLNPSSNGARRARSATTSRLAGRRFVVSIEVDQGKKLAEAWSSCSPAATPYGRDLLYHESFEFTPVFSCGWRPTHAPPRQGRRHRHVAAASCASPFDQTIPPRSRRPLVKATLRNPAISGPAILAWDVEGALRWREERSTCPT